MTYGVQGFNYNYNYSYASSNNNNGYVAHQQQGSNPMQMMQGLAMIFAGMDMIDDGQINGSILQQLMGGQQQPQQCQQNQSWPQPQYPQQQQQCQNPQQQGMMQMFMQMMQMLMQMLMRMMGMDQQ